MCYKSTNTSMIVSGHPSRGPLVEVYSAFKLIEDVSQLVPIILVPRTEERHPQHYVTISCLSVGQDRALETRRLFAIIATARVEVGSYYM